MYKLVAEKKGIESYINTLVPVSGDNPYTFSVSNYLNFRVCSKALKEPISEEDHIPVKMYVTIRTDFSNEVLVPDDGKFYTDCTSLYPNYHLMDDIVLLSAKNLVDRLFDCGEYLPDVIRRTMVSPVGACIYDEEIIVYVTVVIDHNLKTDEHFKLKDCHFEPIDSFSAESYLEEQMLSKLPLIKKGDK